MRRTDKELFWTRDDYIYVTSEDNKFYQEVMRCVESNANQGVFFPATAITDRTNVIFLGQYQQAIDNIGLRITPEKNPEYFL